MLIDYSALENETIEILKNNMIGVLSTSFIDKVTSRNMCIVNIGLDIYFQTNKKYNKYIQMTKNKNVSLCFSNISIEGTAEEVGSWEDEDNKEILELYKDKHASSYEKYGNLDGQVAFKIIPKKISYWKSFGDEPVREIMYVDRKMAERIEY